MPFQIPIQQIPSGYPGNLGGISSLFPVNNFSYLDPATQNLISGLTPSPYIKPDQLSSEAAGADLAAMPSIEGVADQINALNRAAQQTSNAGRIPNATGLEEQSSANILDELRGIIDPGTIGMIQQGAAERGVATGDIGGPNANAALLRALGLTSQDLQQRGQANLSSALARNPGAPIWDPSQLLTTPGEIQNAQSENTRLALAADQAAFNRALQVAELNQPRQGLTGGGGGGGGLGTIGTTPIAPSGAFDNTATGVPQGGGGAGLARGPATPSTPSRPLSPLQPVNNDVYMGGWDLSLDPQLAASMNPPSTGLFAGIPTLDQFRSTAWQNLPDIINPGQGLSAGIPSLDRFNSPFWNTSSNPITGFGGGGLNFGGDNLNAVNALLDMGMFTNEQDAQAYLDAQSAPSSLPGGDYQPSYASTLPAWDYTDFGDLGLAPVSAGAEEQPMDYWSYYLGEE